MPRQSPLDSARLRRDLGLARAREAASPVKYMMPAPAGYSQVVIVSAPKVVFSSTQLAFGPQPGDIRLAFERLQKSIAPLNARLDTVAMSHIYVVARGGKRRIEAADLRERSFADSHVASAQLRKAIVTSANFARETGCRGHRGGASGVPRRRKIRP